MLADTVQRLPSNTFMEWGENTLSFQDFRHAVDRFSATLAESGVRSGDAVILLLPNGPEFATGVFAIAKLGAIAVPLNTAFQDKELQFYLQDSRARTLVTTTDILDSHNDLIDESRDCQVITEIPVSAEPTAGEQRQPLKGPVLYQYSSGSTGTPKRVIRSQEQLVHEANNFTATVNISSSDRILTVVPLFHAHGFGNCLLAAARTGATMVVLPAFKRKSALNTLADKGITVFPGVPFMFSILADSPSIQGMPLPRLRLAFSAGAPLARETFDNFRGKFSVPVRQLYGSTESGSVAINTGSTDGECWSSIGTPMRNVEVRIVGENGEPVSAGESGELVICSQALTHGYANLDEVNQETFRDGCFWSGDVGHKDENGNIYITGRKKLFINAGGNKVDPGQVEEVIARHPAVNEVVVVGLQGQYGQEIIKAAIVRNEGQECTAEQIREWCNGKLADFKVPRVIEFRAEIPRSPLGKILRKYLQEDVA
ncbi:class I adenylate-forming enzyme family protein [Thiogranum longum]|nr:AMP-binding protein [Thiogranum longum]